MDNVSRVHKKKSSKYLIDKVLNMVFTEVLPGIDDSMQICFHEICYDVNVGISRSRLRFKNVYQAYDVLMLEKL